MSSIETDLERVRIRTRKKDKVDFLPLYVRKCRVLHRKYLEAKKAAAVEFSTITDYFEDGHYLALAYDDRHKEAHAAVCHTIRWDNFILKNFTDPLPHEVGVSKLTDTGVETVLQAIALGFECYVVAFKFKCKPRESHHLQFKKFMTDTVYHNAWLRDYEGGIGIVNNPLYFNCNRSYLEDIEHLRRG